MTTAQTARITDVLMTGETFLGMQFSFDAHTSEHCVLRDGARSNVLTPATSSISRFDILYIKCQVVTLSTGATGRWIRSLNFAFGTSTTLGGTDGTLDVRSISELLELSIEACPQQQIKGYDPQ
jgi:hypothetical protein